MSTTTLETFTAARTTAALLPVTGADLTVPLVQGGTTTYAGLDVAASAPALGAALERIDQVLPYYSSAHRGTGYASRVTTDLYEASREAIGRFVGADAEDVVVITRNTTDALNLLSACLPADSSVVHLDIEHHANLLPWRAHDVRCVTSEPTLEATITAIEAELIARPATLLAVTGASNVTGEVLPIKRLAEIAHAHGARILVDAAQLAPHRPIDITTDDIDYVAFSGHKVYAPFGAGTLVGRRDWLDNATPYLAGGGAVRDVTSEDVAWAPAPQRHEAGTPNVIGAAALAAACDALASLPEGALTRHEDALRELLDEGLSTVPGLTPLRIWRDCADRVAVASFVIDGQVPSRIAAILSAEHGIGVRDGRFCAHPLLARISPRGTGVRASLGAGSTSEHVERLVNALRSIVSDGARWDYALADGAWAPVPETRDLNPLGLAEPSRAAIPTPCGTGQ